MKTALTAVFAMSLLSLSQPANAQKLTGMPCPKVGSTAPAPNGKHLNHTPTGSVMRSQHPAHADTAKKPAYPEALLWSFPYP